MYDRCVGCSIRICIELVNKFEMVNQLNLLAYSYEDKVLTLKLLVLGSHENFYRDLKQSL